MTVRTETVLSLLIVLVLALDAFVALQVYQQGGIASQSVPPLSISTATTTPPPNGEDTTPEGAESPVAIAVGVQARNEVQSAVLAAQLAFAEDGVMPADSFAIQARVPGPRFVDGAVRAGLGVVGIDRTDTTILFVTAESEERWICASVDGSSQTTQYGQGTARDAIDDLASCSGSQDGWG